MRAEGSAPHPASKSTQCSGRQGGTCERSSSELEPRERTLATWQAGIMSAPLPRTPSYPKPQDEGRPVYGFLPGGQASLRKTC